MSCGRSRIRQCRALNKEPRNQSVLGAPKRKTVDVKFGRHDPPMSAIKPWLQFRNALRNGREIAAKLGDHRVHSIIDRRLVDGGQPSVPHHNVAIDNDMTHPTSRLDVNELTRRAVHW